MSLTYHWISFLCHSLQGKGPGDGQQWLPVNCWPPCSFSFWHFAAHFWFFALKRCFEKSTWIFSKHVEIFFLVIHPPGGSLRTVQSGMNWSGSLKMHMKSEQVMQWVRYTAIKPMVQTSYINLWPGWKASSTCMERSSKNFHQGAMSVVWRASLLRLAATWPSPWAWCSANEISSCASKLPMILIYFNTYI